MHTVQTKFKNAEKLKDETLINRVISAWDIVCQENESQKSLVTDSQFKSWVQFRDSSNSAMKLAIEEYDGELTASGRQTFESIANAIASANHKDERELTGSTVIIEVNQRIVELQEKKKKWFGFLGK